MTHVMTDMEFYERFEPINHTNIGSESEDWCEWEHLKGIEDQRVWTVTEGDDDSGWANPGYLVVNRLYYIVTREPWVTGQEVAMLWDDDDFDRDDGEPEGAAA